MKSELTFPSAGSALLSISGELDQTTLVHDFWQNLSASDNQAIVKAGCIKIDLANVDRTDTAGLAWLINLIKHSHEKKVKVSFDGVPDKLLNLAELSGAKQFLTP